ncbi:MAG TPA: energy transducer TonB [Candidatus Acidoferrales bacterium]|nr:energy transducer TonB [Candidatus Acidoferrales bacterium]
MTPQKDTLEVSNPVGETSAAHTHERPKADSSHLRSDAVSLDVPVKVHGSRVTDVVLGTTPHTEPFEEKTSTMIVFPQGGVLKMATAVAAGQMVVLTNLKSGHDAICRVVKVRAFAKSQSYVELEFTNRQQGYWGVYFPTDGAGHAPKPAQAAQHPAANDDIETVAHKLTPDVPRPAAPPAPAPVAKFAEPKVAPSLPKPASAPHQHTAQPKKPESPFIGIGSQEEVQAPASSTSRLSASSAFEADKRSRAADSSSSPLSMAELRGDPSAAPPISLGAGVPGEEMDLSTLLAEPSAENEIAAFARSAENPELDEGHPARGRSFGARFDAATLGSTAHPAESRQRSGQNWVLIAAGVAALLVVVAGGGFYLHLWPSGKSRAGAASPVAAAPAPAIDATASQSSVASPVAQLNPITPPVVASVVPPVAVHAAELAPSKPNKVPAAAQAEPKSQPAGSSELVAQPKAPVNQKTAGAVPDISSALNAHPVSSRRASPRETAAAPSLDAAASSANENSGLPGMGASVVIAPPPPPAPKSEVRIGGDIKPPRLISSVIPVYPSVAKSAGVEGSVVVKASIDKEGNVVDAKAISGSPMLRQAAVDAVRKWKYESAILDGEPIATQINVTIQFRR